MVAKNFKFLSRYHGDKQEVLAQMLSVSQSTISEYMNGKKNIPIDVLNKIALRYNVSTDDLLIKDLSSEYDSPQTVNLRDAMNFGIKMYPMLTSNIAKTNDNFNCALRQLQAALCVDHLEDCLSSVKDWEVITRDDEGAMVNIDFNCPHCGYATGVFIFVGVSGVDCLDGSWETD